jgi:hypothetical protein
MTSKKTVLSVNVELSDEQRRTNRVAQLLSSCFQLTSTGTIFKMGVEPDKCEFDDVLYVLNRLYTTGFAKEYNLLPFNVDLEILVNAMTKEVVAWLVPLVLQNIDRKCISGQIDILAVNNESLVYLCDVMSWYWYKKLGGPKPAVTSMVKLASEKKNHQIVQNAALVCPMCYHQFQPPANYKTQSSKAWAYARWFPTHLVEYHKWVKPGAKSTKSKC